MEQQLVRKGAEDAHVAFLKKGLGRHAVKEPTFGFGATVTDPAKFAATSYVLENTGVLAYTGQASTSSTLSIRRLHCRSSRSRPAMPARSASPRQADQLQRRVRQGATAKAILADVKATGFIM